MSIGTSHACSLVGLPKCELSCDGRFVDRCLISDSTEERGESLSSPLSWYVRLCDHLYPMDGQVKQNYEGWIIWKDLYLIILISSNGNFIWPHLKYLPILSSCSNDYVIRFLSSFPWIDHQHQLTYGTEIYNFEFGLLSGPNCFSKGLHCWSQEPLIDIAQKPEQHNHTVLHQTQRLLSVLSYVPLTYRLTDLATFIKGCKNHWL